MITYLNLIDRLEELANKLNYKQSYIANKLNIEQSTYSRWIRGKRFPRRENLLKVKSLLEELQKEYDKVSKNS